MFLIIGVEPAKIACTFLFNSYTRKVIFCVAPLILKNFVSPTAPQIIHGYDNDINVIKLKYEFSKINVCSDNMKMKVCTQGTIQF